ncbi:MAG: endolytic transglycosylase MltG [Muribaculaceae bacterium]|nr:endolytic transglycosylase MltG [Muribaculaceae bacterium]
MNMTAKKKWIIGIIAAIVVIMVACAAPYVFTGAPAEGLIKMRKGSTIESITDSVQANVEVNYGKRVGTMLSLMGAQVENHEGAFRITRGMSPFTAARYIKNGAQSGVRFTFNNVRTLDEWTQRWGDTFMDGPDGMRKALKDSALCAKYGKTPQTIACLLMPDTYEFYWDITPEKMLDRMFDYYNDFWTNERKAKAQRLGLTPDEVATVASIVEEETSKPDERGKVARLYLNRYQQGMRLQADPTVKFAIGDFSIKRITVPMTQINSPYNTYRVNGLPPGPIRLPEKSTIDAVLDAPQHDYLYMCARADFSGYHDFTRDYASHLENAHRYQAALNSRGIK